MRFHIEQLDENGGQLDELSTNDAGEAWYWFKKRAAVPGSLVIEDSLGGVKATHSAANDLLERPQFNPIGMALGLRPGMSGTGNIVVVNFRLPCEMIEFLTIKGLGNTSEGLRRVCREAMFSYGN